MKAEELKKELDGNFVGKDCRKIITKGRLAMFVQSKLLLTTGYLYVCRKYNTFSLVACEVCSCQETLGVIKFHTKDDIIISFEVEFAIDNDWDATVAALNKKAVDQKERAKKYEEGAKKLLEYLASLGYKRDEAEEICGIARQKAFWATEIFGEDIAVQKIIVH